MSIKSHDRIVDSIYSDPNAKAKYQDVKRIIASDSTLDEKTLEICDLTEFLNQPAAKNLAQQKRIG